MILRQLKNEEVPQAMELKITCWTEELAGRADNTLELQEEIDFWTAWLNSPDVHNDIRVFVGAFEGAALLGWPPEVLSVQRMPLRTASSSTDCGFFHSTGAEESH